ncbi:MAG: sulfite reductase [Dehalococcoidia bacterium]|nr:asrC 2 [Dehalococcoidia bacterium]MBF8304418.1 asrC 2 [Dehalococcoidia bacterium]MDO8635098.1 sulfite reductase [Dehalococcoidia bacterium]
MAEPKKTVDVRALKSSGFIRQTESEYFVCRLRIPGGNASSEKLIQAAELAKKYGRGYCHLTFQQSVEIPYVKLSEMDALKAELDKLGLRMANCGPRVRAISACQGCKVNPYGRVDAPGIAAKADEKYFGMDTPAKFKIAYSGCNIGCPNPQENDLGFHGMVEPDLVPDLCNGCTLCVQLCKSRAGESLVMNTKTNLPERDDNRCTYCGECLFCCPTNAWVSKRIGHAVYVGGKHGRFPRWADRVADFVSDEDTYELIEKCVAWYNLNGKRGERFGTAIDRLGMDKFKKDVLVPKFKTAKEWDHHGDRPKGINYHVLHSWDTEESR